MPIGWRRRDASTTEIVRSTGSREVPTARPRRFPYRSSRNWRRLRSMGSTTRVGVFVDGCIRCTAGSIEDRVHDHPIAPEVVAVVPGRIECALVVAAVVVVRTIADCWRV